MPAQLGSVLGHAKVQKAQRARIVRIHLPSDVCPKPTRAFLEAPELDTSWDDVTHILATVRYGDPNPAAELLRWCATNCEKLAATRMAHEELQPTYRFSQGALHDSSDRFVVD
jgi:hypothetical protein